MEFEVRVVGGIESCFASLPLSLLQTLEKTRGGFLPPMLALELRACSGGTCWNLAWSGSASKSAAIEVDQLLAECISLPDHTRVQIKAVANLPKAVEVDIEPSSEDDWEILALNSELAENTILKQVGVVYEGMRFPLWLHGHVVVEFLVTSTSPKKLVVQLVPGTKLAVAPKIRKNGVAVHQGSQKKNSIKEQLKMRALLRVQQSNRNYLHNIINDVEVRVFLTYVAFIHPETAKKFSFDNLQLATIMPKMPQKEIIQNANDISGRRGNNPSPAQGNNGLPTASKVKPRRTVVHLVYSDSVARGHVMLPQSLRQFVGSGLHSWVYINKYSRSPKKDIFSMIISPCRFKWSKNSQGDDHSGNDALESHTILKQERRPSIPDIFLNGDMPEWSNIEGLFSSFSHKALLHGDDDNDSVHMKLEKELVRLWLHGQVGAIASQNDQMKVNSVVLTNETLLHFEIINHKIGNRKKDLPLYSAHEKENGAGEHVAELLYLLRTNYNESSKGDLVDSFEFDIDSISKNADNIHDLELALGKLELGDLIFLDSITENDFKGKFSLTISSLSWLETSISDVTNRLLILLSPNSAKLLCSYDLPPPGHVLIYGPPGSGKTTLTRAVAKHFEEHEEILAHIIFVSCSKLALEKSQTVRQAISGYVSEALACSPSIVIFDDLDNVISYSSDEGSQPSTSTTALVNYFIDILDDYREKSRSSCGYGPIAFVASVQSLRKLPQSLSSSGRFDFHVQLDSPAVSERGAILKHEIEKRALLCSDDVIAEIASKCDGYDAYDLEILVDRTVHAAVSRFLPSRGAHKYTEPILLKEDFSQAMHEFVPVAMRGLMKVASEGGLSGWDDVGGLVDIRNTIQEMIELPSKFPGIFAQSPLRLRSNVLMYGPPGCGKTHIVGAAAAACSLRFISVKGPELLNKYIGASEQAVRDLFSKAAAAAPCLLFFDEFDSIAPKRGHDNTGVTDRVVNQLLTELDGVEALTGVFVFAATSRPDLLDAALLRPGRLDRLLYCDFPTWHERLDILKVLSKKLPLASNVNLETIASMTEGFSGADLQALLSDAQLASVHELLDSGIGDKPGKTPVISNQLLMSVASKARPSVSEDEKRRLSRIYSRFLELKKSVSAQTRDAKGKKATLA